MAEQTIDRIAEIINEHTAVPNGGGGWRCGASTNGCAWVYLDSPLPLIESAKHQAVMVREHCNDEGSESPHVIEVGRRMRYDGRVWIAADVLPRVDMYEPKDGVAEIDGVIWVPAKDLDTLREEEEAEVQAQQTRLEALRRSHEFIAVQEPETRVSASLLLSAVRWVLTGQVDD